MGGITNKNYSERHFRTSFLDLSKKERKLLHNQPEGFQHFCGDSPASVLRLVAEPKSRQVLIDVDRFVKVKLLRSVLQRLEHVDDILVDCNRLQSFESCEGSEMQLT